MPGQTDKLFPRVWEIVRQIPRGQVSNYGHIAELVGQGCDARRVGYAMHATPKGSEVPWQRVVNREGKISLPGPSGEIQRKRLEAEGVQFDARGRIDMKRFGWKGPDPAWAAEYGYHVKPPEPGPSEPEQTGLF